MPETHLDAREPPVPGTPGAGGLVPVLQRIVTWDSQGNPLVRNHAVFTKIQVSDIAMAAASALHVDPDDELAVALGLPPSEFYGMSNLEVMLIKQARWAAKSGETDVIEHVLDRLIGRPKQVSESKSLELTYEDYLKEVGRREAKRAQPSVEAEILDEL